jgi:hypothetical protein
MTPPPRVIVAVAVIVGLIALAIWGAVAAARATRLSPLQRVLGGAAVVMVLAVLTAWVVFAWPAYWD